MKNALLSAVAAVALMSISSAANAWIAVAANTAGTGYGIGTTEEGARRAAVSACQNSTGSTCSQTTSVPDRWYVVAVRCNGRVATAGSDVSPDAAVALAERKIPGCNPGRSSVMASH